MDLVIFFVGQYFVFVSLVLVQELHQCWTHLLLQKLLQYFLDLAEKSRHPPAQKFHFRYHSRQNLCFQELYTTISTNSSWIDGLIKYRSVSSTVSSILSIVSSITGSVGMHASKLSSTSSVFSSSKSLSAPNNISFTSSSVRIWERPRPDTKRMGTRAVQKVLSVLRVKNLFIYLKISQIFYMIEEIFLYFST